MSQPVSLRVLRARRRITAVCLTLAVVLTPAVQLTAWAEGTLLSTSGFAGALGTLPQDPAVQDQVTAELDRQLRQAGRAGGAFASALTGLAETQVPRAVPAILGSPAFLRLWRTALAAAHHQLMLILRARGHLLAITGSALTVNVTVAARTLISDTGLPPQLGRLLPASMPVTVTILDNRALGQARAAVRTTDTLSRILPAATAALALAGLAAARRRRPALLFWFLIPVSVLGLLSALAVHLLTRVGGSPPVTAATSALTAPLTSHLILISAICGTASALLLAASRLVPVSQFVMQPERRTEP
jgi:hypothetical protein